MTQQEIQIVVVFTPDDQAWIRRTAVEVPQFWRSHSIAPVVGDVLRVGGRQFVIEARVWEQEGSVPLLRLFVGGSRARSDTTFG